MVHTAPPRKSSTGECASSIHKKTRIDVESIGKTENKKKRTSWRVSSLLSMHVCLSPSLPLIEEAAASATSRACEVATIGGLLKRRLPFGRLSPLSQSMGLSRCQASALRESRTLAALTKSWADEVESSFTHANFYSHDASVGAKLSGASWGRTHDSCPSSGAPSASLH